MHLEQASSLLQIADSDLDLNTLKMTVFNTVAGLIDTGLIVKILSITPEQEKALLNLLLVSRTIVRRGAVASFVDHLWNANRPSYGRINYVFNIDRAHHMAQKGYIHT